MGKSRGGSRPRNQADHAPSTIPVDPAVSAEQPAGNRANLWPRRWRRIAAAVMLVVVFRFGFDLGSAYPRNSYIRGMLPGEFERNEGLMLSWSDNPAQHPAQTRIVAHTLDRQQVIILVHDAAARQQAIEMLQKEGIAADRVQFVESQVRLPWIRDFGPISIKSFQSGFELLDLECLDSEVPSHDDVPQRLTTWLRQPVTPVPLTLEGGNLLSNGAGTLITTTKILDQNHAMRKYSRRRVTTMLREYFGAQQVIYLKPLQGEPTSHVDMFVTLTAPDQAVVGSYDPEVDPVNAKILDENAAELAKVRTVCGPLRVTRIPMPERKNGRWYTYTNVVYANGALLVPSYPSVDGEHLATVKATYQRLLPGWQVVPIDAETLLEAEGALHCATLNLSVLPSEPAARHP